MADKTLFGRLRKLFSTGVIIRRSGTNLKVVDTQRLQSTGNLETNRLVDRYNRLHSPTNSYSVYQPGQGYIPLRTELFNDFEAMDSDSIISAALDIYAEESTLKNESGDVISIKSTNENITKTLHNLFYDILNIEFNLYPWVRNMAKYGDFFLRLDIVEKFGVTNVTPLTTYEVIREEGFNPDNENDVRFVIDPSMGGGGSYGGGGGQGAKEFLENYEVAHFRLLGDSNFLPYGKSMIESARKTWKQLTLMEDAMLIHRIMRAPERRIFKIDIGNIPPGEVDNYMQQVINKMKKQPYIDENTGDYNLKFNLQNMLEDYYLPVRGGQSGTEIDSLSGMDFTGTEDIEYLKNRMLAALKIPKPFLGFDENMEGKATLAAQDVRFARTIERIQRIVVSELTKIAVVHLYTQGYTDEDLVNFQLSLTNPSTIAEQERLELWSSKVNLIRDMKDQRMLSEEWIYKNVYGFGDGEIEKERANVIEDIKQQFRKNQIEGEGQDPANPPAQQSPEQQEFEEDVDLGGRPKEGPKYNSQTSARGRDPIGRDERRRDGSGSLGSNKNKFNGHSPLAREIKSKLKLKGKKLFLEKNDNEGLLDENNLLDVKK